MKYEQIFFKTNNLNLAATLYNLGFVIDGIYAVDNSEIVEFYFKKTTELERAVDDFWNSRLRVEPNGLLIVRKELLEEIKRKQNEKGIEKPDQGTYKTKFSGKGSNIQEQSEQGF